MEIHLTRLLGPVTHWVTQAFLRNYCNVWKVTN